MYWNVVGNVLGRKKVIELRYVRLLQLMLLRVHLLLELVGGGGRRADEGGLSLEVLQG